MSENENEKSHIIKLRGLPWNVIAQDIIDFLKDVEILNGEKGIYILTSPHDNRPSGDAFVECASENDYNKAFDYHKKLMSYRYIEIFGAKKAEFNYRKRNTIQQDFFVKLRGLPYSVVRDDIVKFFEGLEIWPDKSGVQILTDHRGRATGEAFVQFATAADTGKALKKNHEMIGHRYIEVFRSTKMEYRRRNNFNIRSGPYNRNDSGNNNTGIPSLKFSGGGRGIGGGNMRMENLRGPFGKGDNYNNFDNGCLNSNDNLRSHLFGNDNFGNGNCNSNLFNNMNQFGNEFNRNSICNNLGGFGSRNFDRFNNDNQINNGIYCVHMRGLPFTCDEEDIRKFFGNVHPMNCRILYNDKGFPSGEAQAFFTNEYDAVMASFKHKERMGSRYIELYFSGSIYRGERPKWASIK